MAELIGFKIQIDGQEKVVKSLGEMKQLLKEANFELLSAQQNFGEYSKEALNAAKKVATLKDSLQEAGETAQLFDPGKKFQAFAGALGAVAGGISAVQGAIGLVGDESEDLQKTLVKVQSALALSQGLSAITDSAKDFQRLKAVAVDAFKSIKAAIGSTGIGLIVVAVATLVTYWDDIKEAVSGVSSEQKKLLADSEKNLKTEKEKLDTIDSQDNILKLQGKSEREILNIKIKQTDEVIAATEANIQQQQVIFKTQVEASKRNKEILEGILKFMTVPITALLKAVDLVGKALGKDFGLEEKVFGGLAGLVFKPSEIETEGQKTLKELDNQLTQLKNKRAGYQLTIQQQDAKNADDAAKARQDDIQKELAYQEQLEELRRRKFEESRKYANSLAERDEKEKEQKRQKELEKEKKFLEDRDKYFQEAIQRGLNSLKGLQETAKERNDLLGQLLISQDERELLNLEEQYRKKFELIKGNKEAEVALEKEYEGLKKNLRMKALNDELSGYASAASSISQLLGQTTAAGKAFAIAEATINTYKAGMQVFAAPVPGAPPPASLGVKIATMISALATGFKNVRAIVATKTTGVGNVSPVSFANTPAPITPMASPQVQSTMLNAQAIQQMGSASYRAYVVESDVTNSQERIRRINRAARLG